MLTEADFLRVFEENKAFKKDPVKRFNSLCNEFEINIPGDSIFSAFAKIIT